MLTFYEFRGPAFGSSLFRANSDPQNDLIREALNFARESQDPLTEIETVNFLNTPLPNDSNSQLSTPPISAYISQGQSRAHSKITEHIVSHSTVTSLFILSQPNSKFCETGPQFHSCTTTRLGTWEVPIL